MFRLLAFVVPLGLDSFVVAAALGTAGLGTARLSGIRARLRVSLIFVVFEAGMPLIGLAAGGGIARAMGSAAGYFSGAAVIALGVYMLAWGDDEGRAGRLASTGGVAVLALGISISLDEFAIGFSLGLARLPVLPVIIAVAVQALLASQLGLALGRRISGQLRERAEQTAAVALILLGSYLIVERIRAR